MNIYKRYTPAPAPVYAYTPPAPPAPSAATASVVVGTGAEGALISDINSFRASHGLPALSVQSNLTNKARAWAVHMASGGCGRSSNGLPNICHSSLTDGISTQWSLLEENVGMCSPKNNVSGMESAFERSPEHAANMLNGKIRYIGVGFAYYGDYMYVAEEFMAP